MDSRQLGLGLAPCLLVALVACGERAPTPTATGPRLNVQVGALTLDGVTDVAYRLAVKTPTSTVWERTVRSSDYGDGAGSLSYVGPCDASAANSVHLTVLEIRGSNDALLTDWVDPGELTQPAPCNANADSPVVFDITIARKANQGFFDVAVNFEDIFCSAKLDCLPALLHDGDVRSTTLVAAFACTTGENSPTTLHLDAFELACSDGSAWIDTVPGPGNTNQLSAHVFQTATYRGKERLAPYEKAYWNTAIGLDLASFPQPSTIDCTLRGKASASTAPWSDGMTPTGSLYPYIEWDVEVVRDGLMVCSQHPLDEEGSGVQTRYATPPERTRFASSMPAESCDDGTCDVARNGAICSGTLANVTGPVLFANSPGGVLVTMNGQTSAPMPLPAGYTLTGCCANSCCTN
ncbi:MAG TPA: hypothetical protein PK095_05575 [Myxococcota bacterium]|nr:hypothetical protein [Myxococcota bacterium]